MILGIFKKQNTRLGQDLEQICGIGLDFENGISREEIETKLSGIFAVVHTTYSSLPAIPRWRAVIPFKTPCSPDEQEEIYEFFRCMFGDDLDEHSKNPVQIWYEPACPPDLTNDYVIFTITGEFFSLALQRKIAALKTDATAKRTVTVESNKQKSPTGEVAIPKFEVQNITLVDHADFPKVKSALEHVSSDDRRTWILVGMALQFHFGQAGYELWVEWSKTSS